MVSRRLTFILVILALVVGGVAGGIIGIFAYIDVVGGSAEPSVPISAPTLSLSMLLTPTRTTGVDPQNDLTGLSKEVAGIATQVNSLSQLLLTDQPMDALATQVTGLRAQLDEFAAQQRLQLVVAPEADVATPTRTPRPTRTPTLTSTPTITYTPSPTPLPKQVLFRIVPDESEVRFTLFEEAGPDPGRLTIVGRTNQVAGDILIDFDTPANSRLGTIRVNIRSLETQYGGQGEAMRGDILLSARPEFEFSDFQPTALIGLPTSAEIGETINFQITGDFPLRGVTRSLTFDATVTPVTQNELHGYATTLIHRQDYGLMQSALAEHLVSEDITLEIEFVARAVDR